MCAINQLHVWEIVIGAANWIISERHAARSLTHRQLDSPSSYPMHNIHRPTTAMPRLYAGRRHLPDRRRGTVQLPNPALGAPRESPITGFAYAYTDQLLGCACGTISRRSDWSGEPVRVRHIGPSLAFTIGVHVVPPIHVSLLAIALCLRRWMPPRGTAHRFIYIYIYI